jgi:hypothetical protein
MQQAQPTFGPDSSLHQSPSLCRVGVDGVVTVPIRKFDLKVRKAGTLKERDFLAVEEPLLIRIGSWDLAVTMRTPGNDAELTAGFLLDEDQNQ